MNLLYTILLHLVAVLAFSPLLLGIITKTKAVFAGRWGAPLLQPYYDIFKSLRKGCVYSRTTSWIFKCAPMVSMSAILISCLLMPLGTFKAPIVFWGDMVLFIYLFALARFVMLLAALDTGSSFEGMGASREAAFACLSEGTLFLNFTVLALLSKSLSLSNMLGGNLLFSWGIIGPALLLVVISLFLVLLVENSRIPVDDPDTHLELTMVHEVMILDHSGVDLAYILYTKAVRLFLFAGIILPMVFPFKTNNNLVDTAVFAFGLAAIAVVVGIIESTMARLRLNRVLYLLILAFILAIFGLIVILVRSHS